MQKGRIAYYRYLLRRFEGETTSFTAEKGTFPPEFLTATDGYFALNFETSYFFDGLGRLKHRLKKYIREHYIEK